MKEIWQIQSRLPRRAGNQALKLMENKRFRAGYDFLLLREDSGEIKPGLGLWWTVFQDSKDTVREEMIKTIEFTTSKSMKRPKK
jgi:poly(A) polymerase